MSNKRIEEITPEDLMADIEKNGLEIQDEGEELITEEEEPTESVLVEEKEA